MVSAVVMIALFGSFLAILAAALVYLDVSYRYRQRLLSPETVDQRPVALVFGAGVYPNGQLTPVLADRVRTAADLYHQGKVSKLLMSGDNRFLDYNEPAHMGDFARNLGVPASALAYDYAGRRTYDSCYRAKHIFGQDRLVLVTQAFHLPRALYLCQQLDIDAVGVSADRRSYRAAAWFSLRESFARIRAWLDVHVQAPAVVGGEPIDIFSADYTP
jgi:SanA protein